MKAIIHIGTTNTGNQEKQGFLMQNQALLLQKGFCYPKSLRVANRHWMLVDMVLELVGELNSRELNSLDLKPKSEVNSRDLNTKNERNLLGLNAKGEINSRSRVLSRLKNSRLKEAIKVFEKERDENKDKTFILSAEGIVWDFSSRKHFELLRCVLAELGFDEISFIVYFRELSGYLNSHCSQDIKNNMGFYSGDFAPGKHPRAWIFDYKGICENIESVFGEGSLIVRLLRQDYVGGSMIRDFVHHLGIEWDENFLPAKTKNESFSLLGMELMKRLNTRALGENLNSLLYVARKIFEGAGEERLKFRVNKALAQAYVKHYEASIEWVRARYFPRKKTLFEPVNWDDYQENECLKETKGEDFDKIADFIESIIKSKNIVIENLRDKA